MTATELPVLSQRGAERVKTKVQAPLRFVFPGKFYDPVLNPQGIINLSTAENMLMSKELLQFIHSHFRLTPSHLRYRTALEKGHVDYAVDALSIFLNRTLKPRLAVIPSHFAYGPGIGSLIAHLIWSLCDDGDGVILTTPYYDDFLRDILYPARAVLVAAHIPAEVDSLQSVALEYAEKALDESVRKGTKIKAIILCNPHNPLSRAYPQETLVAYAKFAEKHNIHLIFDEVYANQVYPTKFNLHPQPFISALSLELPCHPSRIHVLAGPSKDLGASGVKIGALVSQYNPDLIQLIQAGTSSAPLSTASDAIFTSVLNDESFLTWFLEENRRRLREAAELACDWLEKHGIPFFPPAAGVFLLCDLAPILRRFGDETDTVDQKLDAIVASMAANGVFMKPTVSGQDPVKTRFRMVFTQERQVMKLALQRMEIALKLDLETI